jgi:hypothetical protein
MSQHYNPFTTYDETIEKAMEDPEWIAKQHSKICRMAYDVKGLASYDGEHREALEYLFAMAGNATLLLSGFVKIAQLQQKREQERAEQRKQEHEETLARSQALLDELRERYPAFPVPEPVEIPDWLKEVE